LVLVGFFGKGEKDGVVQWVNGQTWPWEMRTRGKCSSDERAQGRMKKKPGRTAEKVWSPPSGGKSKGKGSPGPPLSFSGEGGGDRGVRYGGLGNRSDTDWSVAVRKKNG